MMSLLVSLELTPLAQESLSESAFLEHAEQWPFVMLLYASVSDIVLIISDGPKINMGSVLAQG
jgi:hypothetical protein